MIFFQIGDQPVCQLCIGEPSGSRIRFSVPFDLSDPGSGMYLINIERGPLMIVPGVHPEIVRELVSKIIESRRRTGTFFTPESIRIRMIYKAPVLLEDSVLV